MFEHTRAPLLSPAAFLRRWLRYAVGSGAIVAVSLGLGATGYHWIAGLAWVDACLNASMILTGMGPVDAMRSPAAKLFSAAYALYSGVAFLGMAALIVAPVAHRFLHQMHLDLDEPPASARR